MQWQEEGEEEEQQQDAEKTSHPSPLSPISDRRSSTGCPELGPLGSGWGPWVGLVPLGSGWGPWARAGARAGASRLLGWGPGAGASLIPGLGFWAGAPGLLGWSLWAGIQNQ